MGSVTINEYVKRTLPFKNLVESGTLNMNEALNDSCYLNYCIGDTLTVPRFVSIGIVYPEGSEVYVVDVKDTEAIRLPNNNYFISANTGEGLFNYIGQGIDDIIRNGSMSYGRRMGWGVASSDDIPRIAPCYDIATAYVVLLIKCSIAEYTYDSTNGYIFRNLSTYDYDDIVSYPDDYWNNHACLAMWAQVFIGDETNRNVVGGVGVSASLGGEAFTSTLIDEHTVNRPIPSDYILQTMGNMASGYDCLMQGSLTDKAISDTTVGVSSNNYILYYPFCNPTFWDIAVEYNDGFSRFRPAIFSKLKFMSAYRAYNCTGLFYTGSYDDAARNNPITNDNVKKGKISDDGKVNPAVTESSDNKSKGLATDPANMYIASGFNGNETIDPNNYVDETPLSSPKLSPVGIFNRTFAMTAIQLRALADFLWNADDDKMTEILKGLELYGENPLNGIIDCRLYPFDLSPLTGNSEHIIIGRVDTEVFGRKMLTDAEYVIDLGKCTFKKHFNNFLDYKPYTTGRLFLPYCGMVPIDTSEFMGHEISAKLIVDVITGVCCCCIYRDDILIITANGVCGCEISMSGTDSAAYASSMVSSFANAIVSVGGAAAGAIGGAHLAAVGSSMMKHASQTTTLANDRLSEFNQGRTAAAAGKSAILASPSGALSSTANFFWSKEHTPTEYAQRGSSSPSCETWLPQYPYFIIDRPVTDIPSGYGHNVGFACIETGVLSNFSGFTICSNVDTSGFAQATEAERGELKALLEAGVFI